jgi:iron(III) transport system permease protein
VTAIGQRYEQAPRISLMSRITNIRSATIWLVGCTIVCAWFVFVPIGALFFTAFTEDTGFGPGPFSLANFKEAYGHWSILRLFANSLIFATGTAFMTFVLGGIVAFIVERTDAPGREIFHSLALISFALPGLLITMAWMLTLSPNIGWFNQLYKNFTGSSQPLLNIYTMAGMIWALSSHYFPLAYLLLGPALRMLDVRMEEAAVMSGARTDQTALRVTLPILRPAILSTVLLLFVRGIESFEVPRLIGNPARINVFTTEVQRATGQTTPEFGVASALSMALLGICVIAVYFYRQATRNAEAFATITGKGYKPVPLNLGRWRWPATILTSIMFMATLGLPLLTLIWQSFFRNLATPFMPTTSPFTFANYEFVLHYPIFVEAVHTSVLLGGMAATLVVALTFVSAWVTQRAAPRGGWILDAVAFSPIAVPSVIIGASVLFAYLMMPIPVYNTIWILLIAYITLYLPFGMRFATSGMTQIHKELEEAAWVSGASTVQMFIRVLLPLLAPIIVAAWLYVFVLAVRELSASVFLVGPGTHVLGTISLTMWEEGGSYGAVCALGMIQIIPLVAIVAFLRWFERRVSARFRGEGSQSDVA